MDKGLYLITGSVSAMAAFIFCFTITLYIFNLKGFGGGRALISVKDNGNGIPQNKEGEGTTFIALIPIA